MTTLIVPGGYPGGTKITVATWFKVIDFSSFDYGLRFGAGYNFNGHDVPTGGEYSVGVGDLYTTGSSLIPICEWGYSSDSSTNDGAVQALGGGAYIYPDFPDPINSGTKRYAIRFIARGPFYQDVSGPMSSGSPVLAYNGNSKLYYPTIALDCFIFTGGWLENSWNLLVMSADISGTDTMQGQQDSTGFITRITNVTQGSKIWMSLNSIFDAAGALPFGATLSPTLGGGSGLYSGYTQAVYTELNELPALRVNPACQAISMLSGEFAVGAKSAWASNNYNYATVVFAMMQVWFGLYIQPSDASLFYDTLDSGDIAFPAKPYAAQDAFGASNLLFDGGQMNFPKNQIGGNTMLYGEIVDYTPYPKRIPVE
jgi:hypothetical protein